MSDTSFQAFYEELKLLVEKFEKKQMQIKVCLLYTSDAADE